MNAFSQSATPTPEHPIQPGDAHPAQSRESQASALTAAAASAPDTSPAPEPRPVSERQLQANRRNSQKSTGPRTAEGKAVARENATRHALCSRRIVLPCEDEATYRRHEEAIVRGWNPANEDELDMAKRIARAGWVLDRAEDTATAMAELTITASKTAHKYPRPDDHSLDIDFLAAGICHTDPREAMLVERYVVSANRSFHRHREALRKLQNDRCRRERLGQVAMPQYPLPGCGNEMAVGGSVPARDTRLPDTALPDFALPDIGMPATAAAATATPIAAAVEPRCFDAGLTGATAANSSSAARDSFTHRNGLAAPRASAETNSLEIGSSELSGNGNGFVAQSSQFASQFDEKRSVVIAGNAICSGSDSAQLSLFAPATSVSPALCRWTAKCCRSHAACPV